MLVDIKIFDFYKCIVSYILFQSWANIVIIFKDKDTNCSTLYLAALIKSVHFSDHFSFILIVSLHGSLQEICS